MIFLHLKVWKLPNKPVTPCFCGSWFCEKNRIAILAVHFGQRTNHTSNVCFISTLLCANGVGVNSDVHLKSASCQLPQ